MKGSYERVRKLLAGLKPDRMPLYDIIPNDAVLGHFNGGRPVPEGDDDAAARAVAEATDSTRFACFAPQRPRDEVTPEGRRVSYQRWTTWTEHRAFSSSEEYASVKRKEMAVARRELSEMKSTAGDSWYSMQMDKQKIFGPDYYYVLSIPTPGLMCLYDEVGLESFSYYLADCEDVIIEQLELFTEKACRWVELLPEDDPCSAVFIGEDIAFNSGPMFSPEWLDREFFPRVKRLSDAVHARGKLVMYHSDGNINPIVDSIVRSGADILNPIDVNAGMDLKDLHRRYPRLFFAGGIDVTHLLPEGTPQQVADAVTRAIEDTEGRILVGSSTEVSDIVPLGNFLAMRETAMNYKL
ncbi:MAG TPA: hypothetical protein DET40_09340 [Lentisphaeria bacterium]|nr:MAG: hypothetical protein A2X45_08130 [Lentisphaerae bacterium GWF2_50_93]HCE43741.1 hypothetical protein [Lentisphaeria bacterium]